MIICYPSLWDYVQVWRGLFPEHYVQGIMSKILSKPWDYVLGWRGFCSRGIFSWGLCPGDYVQDLREILVVGFRPQRIMSRNVLVWRGICPGDFCPEGDYIIFRGHRGRVVL